jgi:hypothetical protein
MLDARWPDRSGSSLGQIAVDRRGAEMSPDFRRPRLDRLSALWLVANVLLVACTQAPAAPTGTQTPAAQTDTPVPATTASGEAASSGTPVVFSSTRYPYSITLPIGWVATPASATWDGTGAPTSDDSAVDLFGPVGVGTAFVSAAPMTSLLAAWVADGIAANFRIHGDTCPQTPDSVEPVTIGGQPGTLVAWNCGILINAAFTVAHGYGYRFAFRDPRIQAATDPADKATFTTMLGSVVFH